MADQQQPPAASESASAEQTWRGIDFSGLTLVVGVGTGRLIALLAEQVRLAGGQLVVMSYQPRALAALKVAAKDVEGFDDALLLQGRSRQLPLADETVDLLVLNGVMREAPPTRYERLLNEVWRVLVQGGQLRISDVIDPGDEEHNQAWATRNELIRDLGRALGQPVAVAVDVRQAAIALRQTGYEDLKLSLMPGYALTDAWLEETTQAIGTMLGRVVDPQVRAEIAENGLLRLVAAYQAGDQRAAERLVLSGYKVGELVLNMQASFTEDDLLPDEDD